MNFMHPDVESSQISSVAHVKKSVAKKESRILSVECKWGGKTLQFRQCLFFKCDFHHLAVEKDRGFRGSIVDKNRDLRQSIVTKNRELLQLITKKY